MEGRFAAEYLLPLPSTLARTDLRLPPLQVPNTEGLVLEGDKKAKKNLDIVLHGVWGREARSPLQPEVYTPARVPACSTPVLKALAGKAGKARRKLAELKLEQQAEGERLRAVQRLFCAVLHRTVQQRGQIGRQ